MESTGIPGLGSVFLGLVVVIMVVLMVVMPLYVIKKPRHVNRVREQDNNNQQQEVEEDFRDEIPKVVNKPPRPSDDQIKARKEAASKLMEYGRKPRFVGMHCCHSSRCRKNFKHECHNLDCETRKDTKR